MRWGLLFFLFAACAQQATVPTTTIVEAHAQVDELLDRGEAAAARTVLETTLAGVEVSGRHGADHRAMIQDTFFRLARVSLDAGDARAALEAADRGLALGEAEDVFVANLLVARGAAKEKLGRADAAASDYARALEINEVLLGQALGAP